MTDEEYKEWLSGLKAGDFVCVHKWPHDGCDFEVNIIQRDTGKQFQLGWRMDSPTRLCVRKSDGRVLVAGGSIFKFTEREREALMRQRMKKMMEVKIFPNLLRHADRLPFKDFEALYNDIENLRMTYEEKEGAE